MQVAKTLQERAGKFRKVETHLQDLRREVAEEQEKLAETVQAVEQQKRAQRDSERTNQVRRDRLKQEIARPNRRNDRSQWQ